jgi:hypothetical protein
LYILIALFIAGAFGYVYYLNWQVSHYKAKYEREHLEFQTYVEEAKKQSQQFSKEADTARKVADEVMKQREAILEESYKTTIERIRNDKSIATIFVPRSSVRVLNSSARGPTFTGVAPKSSKETDSAEGSSITTPVNLTVIFETVVENNKNHLDCVFQVDELQKFYNRLRDASIKHDAPN